MTGGSMHGCMGGRMSSCTRGVQDRRRLKHYDVSALRALPQRRRDKAMYEVHDLLLLRQGVPDEELEKNAQASL